MISRLGRRWPTTARTPSACMAGGPRSITGQARSSAAPIISAPKACGNRRSTRCVACAEVYRHDARHLAMAGLIGGEEVPASVVTHPMVFVTFTAPSFGSVHCRPKSGPAPCHPGSPTKRCAHGHPLACFDRHEDNDARIGQPICADCYRYDTHVLFNAHLTESVAPDDDLCLPLPGQSHRHDTQGTGGICAALVREGRRVPGPWCCPPPCRGEGRRHR